MDQDAIESQLESISLSNLEISALKKTHQDSRMDDVKSILQSTASHISKTALSSKENDLILKSNNEVIQQQLEEVLKAHFHPLNLTTLPSIVVYLLLKYFLLSRENREVESAKKLYEDHIALLKDKNSELEGKMRESAVSKSAAECSSCKALQQRTESLSVELEKLRKSYNEVSIKSYMHITKFRVSLTRPAMHAFLQ